MFGWEFPPFNSGGLGVACQGLTKGLANQDIEVTFVVPYAPKQVSAEHVKLLDASRSYGNIKVKIKGIPSLMAPYMTSDGYSNALNHAQLHEGDPNYGANIYEEAERYAKKAELIALSDDFDVIHAHDWMTYKAGINAKKAIGKPLVLHIHSTEFDRTGGNNNEYIYSIEREGFYNADMICSVSQFTKNKVCFHYGVNPGNVTVVHNAIEFNNNVLSQEKFKLKDHYKIVLFLGRITIQKGPDWFLYTAKKVFEKDPNIKFVFAGSGDMELGIIEKAAELGIAHNIIFSGFLRGRDIDRAYQMADLYVMPSISEPFGLTPLEAMRNGTPAIISKQSGVSEVINNCIKVDFWDTEKMAEKILEVLHNKSYHHELKIKGQQEAMKFNWNEPARKCIDVYNKVIKENMGEING
ncbi:MAG: glycosyltransferase family 4 protein [Candidatus Woesearchaeota archaeon]